MRKIYLFIFINFLCATYAFAQSSSIDLIEYFSTPIKFFVGYEAPAPNWYQKEFKDTAWFEKSGASIWNLDFDVSTKPEWGTGKATTYYARINFNSIDTNVFEELSYFINCNDAFVAYINGVEIARANIGNTSEPTSFDQFSDSLGFYSESVLIDKNVWYQLLDNDTNVFAIEVHNDANDEGMHGFYLWMSAEKYDMDIPYAVTLDSTNLPIVKITTEAEAYIPSEPKIKAHMQIINNTNATYNYVTSNVFNFEGDIGIEIRGSTSDWLSPKKSYGFETRTALGENNNVSLLGMPDENDWILYAPYADKTFLRDVLTYKLANDLGHYAPRTKFVELILNNKLMGTYVLMEKIKRGPNRVDISKLKPNEIAGDSLTGGYIFKIDKKEGNYDGWESEYGSAENESNKYFIQYYYPKYDEIVVEQKNYIQNFMSQFEKSLRVDNFEDPSEGYRKYISVKSFIDYFIINELTKNMDGYRISTFMHKDRDDKGGKLRMGPVWDYNLTFGNFQGSSGDEIEGWAVNYSKLFPSDGMQVPFWWDRLLQDSAFVSQLKARWFELRATSLDKDAIYYSIDSMVNYTHDARIRNFSVWKRMFTEYVWPNNPVANDYDGEIVYLKEWIDGRLTWIDDNIGAVREKVVYVSIESKKVDEFFAVGAYPNPFIDDVNITIELEANHHVTIEIYNSLGQKVSQLAHSNYTQGKHEFQWNGYGKDVALSNSGIYIYSVIIDGVKAYNGKIVKQ